MEAFFHNLKRGDSFLAAFQEATARTEMLTRRGSRGANSKLNKYNDLSVQHPLLALDGDQGRNVLSRIPVEKRTAIKIEELYLGAGADYDTNYAGNPADIVAVADTIYLEPSESAADLYLMTNPQVGRIKEAAVNVRLPDTELKKTTSQRTGYAEQREISELVEVNLLCDYSQRCQRNTDDVFPNLFSEPGKYDLYYFISDNETHDISPVWRSVVYKQKADNAAPDNFNLHYPQDGSEQATSLVLNWQATTDPDDDPVTYRLLIAEDFQFERIVYQASDLYQTAVFLGPNLPLRNGTTGLQDASRYYWKVEAIDQYGAITPSEDVFSFKTDNTNAPPWIGSQFESSAVHFTALDQAVIDFWQTDELGQFVLDEAGNPMLLQSEVETVEEPRNPNSDFLLPPR